MALSITDRRADSHVASCVWATTRTGPARCRGSGGAPRKLGSDAAGKTHVATPGTRVSPVGGDACPPTQPRTVALSPASAADRAAVPHGPRRREHGRHRRSPATVAGGDCRRRRGRGPQCRAATPPTGGQPVSLLSPIVRARLPPARVSTPPAPLSPAGPPMASSAKPETTMSPSSTRGPTWADNAP